MNMDTNYTFWQCKAFHHAQTLMNSIFIARFSELCWECSNIKNKSCGFNTFMIIWASILQTFAAVSVPVVSLVFKILLSTVI